MVSIVFRTVLAGATVAATAMLMKMSSVSGFVVVHPVQQPTATMTPGGVAPLYGIFDQLKKGMESGYAGGEDSPYAKIQEADRKKEEIRQQKAAERKKRGFKEIKDLKKGEKTFVKTKYNQDGTLNTQNTKKAAAAAPPKEEKKKLFGLF